MKTVKTRRRSCRRHFKAASLTFHSLLTSWIVSSCRLSWRVFPHGEYTMKSRLCTTVQRSLNFVPCPPPSRGRDRPRWYTWKHPCARFRFFWNNLREQSSNARCCSRFSFVFVQTTYLLLPYPRTRVLVCKFTQYHRRVITTVASRSWTVLPSGSQTTEDFWYSGCRN